jgi:hypothetical protein
MAFTVETGAVIANANAYMTTAQYRTHHTDRGKAVLTSDTGQSDALVQAAIVKATDYIDKRFGRRFRGGRKERTQSLEFPRTDMWDDDGYLMSEMPAQLLKATAEYAWLATQQATDLAPPPDGTAGTVEETTEKVGPISTTVKFAKRPMTSTGNPLTESLPEYPQADLWIEELLAPIGSRELYRG